MGFMRDQAIRLLRDSWGGGGTQQLAEEIYTILTADVPVNIDSPVDITVRGHRTVAPLVISNFTSSPISLRVNNSPIHFGGRLFNVDPDSLGSITETFQGDTIGGVFTVYQPDVYQPNSFGNVIGGKVNLGGTTTTIDGITLGGNNIQINSAVLLDIDTRINQGGSDGTRVEVVDCCRGFGTGGGSMDWGTPNCKNLDIVLSFGDPSVLFDPEENIRHIKRFLRYQNIPTDSWQWWVVFYSNYLDISVEGDELGAWALTNNTDPHGSPDWFFGYVVERPVIKGPTFNLEELRSYLNTDPLSLGFINHQVEVGDFLNESIDALQQIEFRKDSRRVWFDFPIGYASSDIFPTLHNAGGLPTPAATIAAFKAKKVAIYPMLYRMGSPPAPDTNAKIAAFCETLATGTGGHVNYFFNTSTEREAAYMLRNNLVCSGKTRVFREGEFTGEVPTS